MKINDLRRVLIAGAGEIGRQIAVSCVRHGFAVTLYDISVPSLEAAGAACRQAAAQLADGQPGGESDWLRLTQDPAAAGADADLLIESVPERLLLKKEVFARFAEVCPPQTIFTTNTSVFLPSMFLKSSGRPAQLAALHFVMGGELTEIMPHVGTSAETVETLREFSRRIGHTAIVLKREQPGHLVNTLMMSMNNAALTLAANGVADPADIDRAWMKATHERRGPFGLLDLVGLRTALEITEYGARVSGSSQVRKNAGYLRQLVEQGRLGIESGCGFYQYPNPAFLHPDFLAAESDWGQAEGNSP